MMQTMRMNNRHTTTTTSASSSNKYGHSNNGKRMHIEGAPPDDDDADDDKYNRQWKNKQQLLRSRRQRRNKQGFSSLSSANIAGIVMVSLFLLFLLYNSIAKHLQASRMQQKLQKLHRAERLWQQRQDKEFDGVAPHAIQKKTKQQQQQHAKNHDETKQDQAKAAAADSALTTFITSYDLLTRDELQQRFVELREMVNQPGIVPEIRKLLTAWLEHEDQDIRHNVLQKHPLWITSHLLPPLMPQNPLNGDTDDLVGKGRNVQPKSNFKERRRHKGEEEFFKVHRSNEPPMAWEHEYQQLLLQHDGKLLPGPPVDYTQRDKYVYPDLLEEPPAADRSLYPQLKPLRELMQDWPQDQDKHGMIHETLLHFNYSDTAERAMAQRFRDAELPFKLYDVPEIEEAGRKWTDEYVAYGFGERQQSPKSSNGSGTTRNSFTSFLKGGDNDVMPAASGTAQESTNNYFAFYVDEMWVTNTMGLPPVRNNDWPFSKWAQHARYADAVALPAGQPHFYWQSGAPKEERYKDYKYWGFIGRDLPSFSSTTENFFVFHPEQQKGIQCRFGERGVVAATHYDGGRNMIGMMTGAKRYILSPPNQCSKLGIFTGVKNPIKRHSLLNFGHIQYLHNDTVASTGMSKEERAWLERAATAQSVETVLKKGEVLYLPSNWFHYIISVQKSAQCNVRSGVDMEQHERFGGREDVTMCIDSIDAQS